MGSDAHHSPVIKVFRMFCLIDMPSGGWFDTESAVAS